MEEEYKFLPMGTSTKDSMAMENQKEMEYTNGTTVLSIRDSSKMGFGMGMDNGHMEKKNMKANI